MDLNQLKQIYSGEEAWRIRLAKIHTELSTWARWNCDSIIRDGKWRDVWDKAQCGSREDKNVAESFAQQLCSELLKTCDTKLNEEPDSKKREDVRAAIYQNQERFKRCPLKLVETIVNCLRAEEILWKNFTDTQLHVSDMQVGSSDTDILNLEAVSPVHSTVDTSVLSTATSGSPLRAADSLNMQIIHLRSDADNVEDAMRKLRTKELNYSTDMPHIMSRLKGLSESMQDSQNDSDRNLYETLTTVATEQSKELKLYREEFLTLIGETCNRIENIVPLVEREIVEWKELQKMHYLKLLSPEPVRELNELSRKCADVGDTLFTFQNMLSQCDGKLFWLEDLGEPIELCRQLDHIRERKQFVEDKLKFLIQRSVVVTIQPPNIIQVTSTKSSPGTSKSFPAKLRILALEKMGLQSQVKISAELHLESKLNGESSSKPISLELHNGQTLLDKEKSGIYDLVVASFESLQVRKFNRPKRARKKTANGPDHLFVCEQKFRLVFTGVFQISNNLGNVPLRAVSLPVTITTNSSQESDCTAALHWQCWNSSADNDHGPYIWPERVPWSQVSAMLNKKMEVDTGRGLPEDQLLYLADLLNGGTPNDGNYEDLTISWNQFAKEKMEGRDFTFWKWFHASVNILEDHLKGEWNDGKIYGFLSKKKARELLLQCKPGVFLLRIGESYVSDSGPKITGAVSPVVVRERKKNGQVKIKVDFIEPYTLKELELHGTVGQILASTDADIKYLFPNMIPREEAFKNYTSSKVSRKSTQNDGYSEYIGRTIVFKLDLLGITDDDQNDCDEDYTGTEDDMMTGSDGPGSGSWASTYANTLTPMSDITAVGSAYSAVSPDAIDQINTPFSPDSSSVASPQQQQQQQQHKALQQQQHVGLQQQPSASNTASRLPQLAQLLQGTGRTGVFGDGVSSTSTTTTNQFNVCRVTMTNLDGSTLPAASSSGDEYGEHMFTLDENQEGGFMTLANSNEINEMENVTLANVSGQHLITGADCLLSSEELDCLPWDQINPTFNPDLTQIQT